MIITKRDGRKQKFDRQKIVDAILKAFEEVDGEVSQSAKDKASEIARYVESLDKDEINVEEIQDIIENKLMNSHRKDVAKAFIIYRNKRSEARKTGIDTIAKEYLSGENEYLNTENSNKNPKVLNVQRDYLAGIVSTDFSRRYLLPKDVIEAHDEGIIHFHDIDYHAENAITNCCLINLEDMLQNGTVINNVRIDKPHKFLTACTIATQIILGVSSNQYGGCSVSIAHLAPFLRDSYNFYVKKYTDYGLSESQVKELAEMDTKKELEAGIQTFNYQVNSMVGSNGQAAFLSVFMYISENEEYKHEIAEIIEEFLKQRIQGLKNESGVYVTQAFPKLLYVLEPDNIKEGTEYWYLTELAAKCTAKRMVPDYISEKIMKELKDGDCFACMGCVDGDEVISYRFNGNTYTESFRRMWERTSLSYPTKIQPGRINDEYRDTSDTGLEIWDNAKKDFTDVKRIIRNKTEDWLELTFSNGRILDCTLDHPFETQNRGVVLAKDLTSEDEILIDRESATIKATKRAQSDVAWALGVILCDGSYANQLVVSLGTDETDIGDAYTEIIKKNFGLEVKAKKLSRGDKGEYIDYHSSPNSSRLVDVADHLKTLFGGVVKKNRHIPSEVFEWNLDARLAFLAGMVDADGYINNNTKLCHVQIGSTNKELALQQMLLAQSCGMFATMYRNRYDSKNKYKIRYRVEFVPSDELMQHIVSAKKKEHMTNNTRHNASIATTAFAKLTGRAEYKREDAYSYDVTTESEHFTVSGLYSHNCRSFLMPYKDKNGNKKYWGRFNLGVCTLNLPDIAFSSNKDMDEFWRIFNERIELCHKGLKCKYERLANATSDVSPLLWQYGVYARLGKHESIKPLLHNNYSSISLGYAGLYECVKYMTGCSHSDGGVGHDFAIEVMKAIKAKCDQWQKEENIGYSPYGSPIESTTYKFAKSLKRRFGDDIFVKMDGCDRNYITNSVHIPVFEEIDPFTKLGIEAEFQPYSTGGYISYIECSDLTSNTQAIIQILQYIYENVMYAELNTKSDYCMVCGYDGEIKIIDEDGHLDWECPNCGNRDHDKMWVTRRTCGKE